MERVREMVLVHFLNQLQDVQPCPKVCTFPHRKIFMTSSVKDQFEKAKVVGRLDPMVCILFLEAIEESVQTNIVQ